MEVWTLIFENIDFADCNGVFSTKEKAIDAFNQHCERCNDIWHNPTIAENSEDWVLLEFYYHDEHCEGNEACFIQKEILDEI